MYSSHVLFGLYSPLLHLYYPSDFKYPLSFLLFLTYFPIFLSPFKTPHPIHRMIPRPEEIVHDIHPLLIRILQYMRTPLLLLKVKGIWFFELSFHLFGRQCFGPTVVLCESKSSLKSRLRIREQSSPTRDWYLFNVKELYQFLTSIVEDVAFFFVFS
jgi:hypothetical protein